MRGTEIKQATFFTTMTPERMVPATHPLRKLKELADAALRELSPVFDEMYSSIGRPSQPPERLLKGSLLMALFSIRSENLLCEQLNYNMLYRWFLDMGLDEPGFVQETFSKNRQRLLDHDVAKAFFRQVVRQAQEARLMSDEHFSVDGTLIEAWASAKSFRRKGEKPEDRPPPDDKGNPTVDFRGEKRSNETHQSVTDPDSRLARKSPGDKAKLSYAQHALMENRNGMLVDLCITHAAGTTEREAAIALLEPVSGGRRRTVAADKAYDSEEFVEQSRGLRITPHVTQNIDGRRSSRIDARTTRHPGYEISQRTRKRIEEIFGWMKTVGNFRKTRYRGIERTQMASYLVGTAYNLLRMAKLALA